MIQRTSFIICWPLNTAPSIFQVPCRVSCSSAVLEAAWSADTSCECAVPVVLLCEQPVKTSEPASKNKVRVRIIIFLPAISDRQPTGPYCLLRVSLHHLELRFAPLTSMSGRPRFGKSAIPITISRVARRPLVTPVLGPAEGARPVLQTAPSAAGDRSLILAAEKTLRLESTKCFPLSHRHHGDVE